MVEKKLAELVTKSLSRGMRPKAIKKAMMKRGYDEKTIGDTISFVLERKRDIIKLPREYSKEKNNSKPNKEANSENKVEFPVKRTGSKKKMVLIIVFIVVLLLIFYLLYTEFPQVFGGLL